MTARELANTLAALADEFGDLPVYHDGITEVELDTTDLVCPYDDAGYGPETGGAPTHFYIH